LHGGTLPGCSECRFGVAVPFEQERSRYLAMLALTVNPESPPHLPDKAFQASQRVSAQHKLG
jgi:hypothetical protein